MSNSRCNEYLGKKQTKATGGAVNGATRLRRA